MSELKFTPCACMGPQGGDPYCPCHMRSLNIDGYHNCYGDREAMLKRSDEIHERLRKAIEAWNTRAGDAK